jgi:hypothetical protein
MRRIAGLVLVALGVALVAFAIALPSYVYPRVQKSPEDPNLFLAAQGKGVTVLLAQSEGDGGIRVLNNQTVDATRRVRGEVRPNAPRPTGNNVFYRLAFQLTVQNQPKGLLLAYLEGGSMDGKTALANNCCGDYYVADSTKPQGVSIKHEGLTWKFPFGTKKQNYPFWDINVQKALTAKYDGTEKLDGLTTYRFVQQVPDAILTQQVVPGALVGAPAQASVTADEVYANTRTLWVEPRTGAIIKGAEKVNERLVYNGTEAPVLQGTIAYTDATVQAQVDKYKGDAASLKFVTTTGPIVGWILGPILIVLGFGLLLLSRRPNDGDDDDDLGDSEETADDRENQQHA